MIKKSKLYATLYILIAILICISIFMINSIYKTIKLHQSVAYNLTDMKAITNNQTENSNIINNINNVDVIGVNLPYVNTTLESTAEDCSTIGISMFQTYQGKVNVKGPYEMNIDDLQYNSDKIIKGNLDDFIIEITFNTKFFPEDSPLIKEYTSQGKNRPLLKTRFHIKRTDKPYTYKLVAIGDNL